MINLPLRHAKPHVVGQALLPGVAAVVLGFLVLFAVGFARSAVLHEAAHDTRHSFAFPCH
jgi:cobalt transporter subunit CbtB